MGHCQRWIECESCLSWQHFECVREPPPPGRYLCADCALQVRGAAAEDDNGVEEEKEGENGSDGKEEPEEEEDGGDVMVGGELEDGLLESLAGLTV